MFFLFCLSLYSEGSGVFFSNYLVGTKFVYFLIVRQVPPHPKSLRYTGYQNFINGPISRVLLLILVLVQLLSCLFKFGNSKFLITTLSHNLIKEKLTELIEQTFNREGSLYLACNDKNAFFTSEQLKRYKLWSCQKMCDALHYLLDNIFKRFASKLYRQIVGIPMDTNCAPLVADLLLFSYERLYVVYVRQ